jgi:hypothetical protein
VAALIRTDESEMRSTVALRITQSPWLRAISANRAVSLMRFIAAIRTSGLRSSRHTRNSTLGSLSRATAWNRTSALGSSSASF